MSLLVYDFIHINEQCKHHSSRKKKEGTADDFVEQTASEEEFEL